MSTKPAFSLPLPRPLSPCHSYSSGGSARARRSIVNGKRGSAPSPSLRRTDKQENSLFEVGRAFFLETRISNARAEGGSHDAIRRDRSVYRTSKSLVKNEVAAVLPNGLRLAIRRAVSRRNRVFLTRQHETPRLDPIEHFKQRCRDSQGQIRPGRFAMRKSCPLSGHSDI